VVSCAAAAASLVFSGLVGRAGHGGGVGAAPPSGARPPRRLGRVRLGGWGFSGSSAVGLGCGVSIGSLGCRGSFGGLSGGGSFGGLDCGDSFGGLNFGVGTREYCTPELASTGNVVIRVHVWK
jgi:hypothetical protein